MLQLKPQIPDPKPYFRYLQAKRQTVLKPDGKVITHK